MDIKRMHANTIDMNFHPKYSGSSEYLSVSSTNIHRLSRDESVSSKTSIQSYLLPYSRIKSVDASNGSYPRTDKTRRFAKHLIETSSMMLFKYEAASNNEGQNPDYDKICSKLDERINLVQDLQNEYDIKDAAKEEVLKELKRTILEISPNKNQSNSSFTDSQSFFSICREMCYIESTLESFSGRLQFQILDLESISRINAFDMFELSIKSGVDQKFKTRVKIEKMSNKNVLHQTWDSRTFTIYPLIDDELYIRFSEVKTLNKSNVLIEKTLTGISDLISASPNIFTIWLTPLGTIKLKFIVQWNGMIENNNRPSTASQHPEEDRLSTTSGRISPNSIAAVRRRDHNNSSSQRTNFRHSANIENLSRYVDKNLENSSSVENITEVPGEETLNRHKEEKETSKLVNITLRQPPLIKTDDESTIDNSYVSIARDADSSVNIDMANIHESPYNQSELSDTEYEENKSHHHSISPDAITSEINVLQSPVISDTNNSNIYRKVDSEYVSFDEKNKSDKINLTTESVLNKTSEIDYTKSTNEEIKVNNDNSSIDIMEYSNKEACDTIKVVVHYIDTVTEDSANEEVLSDNMTDCTSSKEVVDTKDETIDKLNGNCDKKASELISPETISESENHAKMSHQEKETDDKSLECQNEETEIKTNEIDNSESAEVTNEIEECQNEETEIKTNEIDNSESADVTNEIEECQNEHTNNNKEDSILVSNQISESEINDPLENVNKEVSDKEIENTLSNFEASLEESSPEVVKTDLSSEKSNENQEAANINISI